MSDTVTSDELKSMMNDQNPPCIIDVRRKADYHDDPSMITGAVWKDPEDVDSWSNELSGKEVVIYCVRGGSVSKSVLGKLREHGITTRYIEGGFEAWKRSGKSASE